MPIKRLLKLTDPHWKWDHYIPIEHICVIQSRNFHVDGKPVRGSSVEVDSVDVHSAWTESQVKAVKADIKKLDSGMRFLNLRFDISQTAAIDYCVPVRHVHAIREMNPDVDPDDETITYPRCEVKFGIHFAAHVLKSAKYVAEKIDELMSQEEIADLDLLCEQCEDCRDKDGEDNGDPITPL